jgi:hypothetical protein
LKTFEIFGHGVYVDKCEQIEKEFLELSHIDDLEIKFNLIEYPNDMFYFYYNDIFFHIDKKNSILGIINIIWNRFYDFDITFNEITDYLHNIICDNYFNTNDNYLIYDFSTGMFNKNFIH